MIQPLQSQLIRMHGDTSRRFSQICKNFNNLFALRNETCFSKSALPNRTWSNFNCTFILFFFQNHKKIVIFNYELYKFSPNFRITDSSGSSERISFHNKHHNSQHKNKANLSLMLPSCPSCYPSLVE